MPKLFVASSNPDKLREIRQLLAGTGWEVIGKGELIDYPDPEENGNTFADNALIKAREGYQRTGYLTIADDSGLEVNALGGRPGVFSARFAGPDADNSDNVDLLLKLLAHLPAEKREAVFRCAVALVGPGIEAIWEGAAEGIITDTKRGENGFGYDPVFLSRDIGVTFAEAAPDEKNRVSHRGRALAELPKRLEALNPGQED